MPKRYPLRTVLLMIVALAAFGRLWCLTHPPEVPEQTPTTPAEPARPTTPATPPTPPPGPPSLEAPADTGPGGPAGSLPVEHERAEAAPGTGEPETPSAADGDDTPGTTPPASAAQEVH